MKERRTVGFGPTRHRPPAQRLMVRFSVLLFFFAFLPGLFTL